LPESKEILYYKRYVDDILIIRIFDQSKTDGKTIMNHMNNRDKHLEFKLLEEENSTINYLDLSIHRNTNSINIGIYRKPTHTDVTIQFPSQTCSIQFLYKLNVNTTNPKKAKQQEWNNNKGRFIGPFIGTAAL
jgi:hypothetical protein